MHDAPLARRQSASLPGRDAGPGDVAATALCRTPREPPASGPGFPIDTPLHACIPLHTSGGPVKDRAQQTPGTPRSRDAQECDELAGGGAQGALGGCRNIAAWVGPGSGGQGLGCAWSCPVWRQGWVAARVASSWIGCWRGPRRRPVWDCGSAERCDRAIWKGGGRERPSQERRAAAARRKPRRDDGGTLRPSPSSALGAAGLGVTTIVFFLIRLLPGDPAYMIAGSLATQDVIASVRQQLGLDLRSGSSTSSISAASRTATSESRGSPAAR